MVYQRIYYDPRLSPSILLSCNRCVHINTYTATFGRNFTSYIYLPTYSPNGTRKPADWQRELQCIIKP